MKLLVMARMIPMYLFSSNTTTNTSTADNVFKNTSAPIINLINAAVNPLLGIVGALGALYCILLGAKLAKAEEPQDREKAKQALKNAVIGFVLIFVLLVALKVGMPALTTWYTSQNS